MCSIVAIGLGTLTTRADRMEDLRVHPVLPRPGASHWHAGTESFEFEMGSSTITGK